MVRELVSYYTVRCDHPGCTERITTPRTKGQRTTSVSLPDWQRFGLRDFCLKHWWPECYDCGQPMRPPGTKVEDAKWTVRYSDRWPLCKSCSDRPNTNPVGVTAEIKLDSNDIDQVRWLVSGQPDAERLLDILGIGDSR